MNILKLILVTASALKPLNYSFLTDEIILAVDFHLKKWDVILSQINSETSKNYSSRYKSGLWTIFESRYDVIKRECRELLKTLKKVRFWLYEVQFIIKINVNILIIQFNRSAVDLSETLMTRWLTWIHLFDFDVRHVLDKRYTATDELFRKSYEFSNDIDEIHEKTLMILLMINLIVCKYVQCKLTRTMMNSFWKMNILKSFKELLIIWSR